MRLSDLPRHIPPLPDGRRVSVATTYRWSLHGLSGLRLRRFRMGGSWCTTLEEVNRWAQAQTAASGSVAS